MHVVNPESYSQPESNKRNKQKKIFVLSFKSQFAILPTCPILSVLFPAWAWHSPAWQVMEMGNRWKKSCWSEVFGQHSSSVKARLRKYFWKCTLALSLGSTSPASIKKLKREIQEGWKCCSPFQAWTENILKSLIIWLSYDPLWESWLVDMLCSSNLLYEQQRATACHLVDVKLSGSSGSTNTGFVCDAISLGG